MHIEDYIIRESKKNYPMERENKGMNVIGIYREIWLMRLWFRKVQKCGGNKYHKKGGGEINLR